MTLSKNPADDSVIDNGLDRYLKLNLKVENVLAAMGSFDELAVHYQTAQPSDPDCHHKDREFKTRDWTVLSVAPLSFDPPASLAITKQWTRFKQNLQDGSFPGRLEGEEIEEIHFTLFKGDGDSDLSQEELEVQMCREIGVVVLEHKGNAWHLNHRWIEPPYRGKGLFPLLVKLSEQFVQATSETLNSPQKIISNAAQATVLNALERQGYTPSNSIDQERLDRIKNDDDVEWSPAFVNPSDETGNPTTVWVPELDKAAYAFEPGTVIRSEQNALRVNLEKTFEPSPVERVRSSLHDRLTG